MQTAFAGIAAHRDATLNLTYGDQTARGVGELVSHGYFSTLALRPALGRLLTPMTISRAARRRSC